MKWQELKAPVRIGERTQVLDIQILGLDVPVSPNVSNDCCSGLNELLCASSRQETAIDQEVSELL